MATPVGITKRTRARAGALAALISTDSCPRACGTQPNLPGTAAHLLSDHADVERMRQCTKCMCIIQSVDNQN